jgi:outer membrane protein assembly factor BamB
MSAPLLAGTNPANDGAARPQSERQQQMRWRHAVAVCVGALVLGGVSGPALAASPPGPAVMRTTSRSIVSQAEAAAQQATVVTATRLSASRRSSAYDTVVTFTARVTARRGSPGGQVLFADASDGSYLAAGPLRHGTATLSTAALAPGARRIIAEYLGSKAFRVSRSGQVAVKVAAAGADAVAYQVDASHDGYQARESLSTRGLTRKWTRTLGVRPVSGSNGSGDVSYPLIAGGRVFVTVESGQAHDTALFALNATTGRTEWSAGLRGLFGFSGLAYDGRRVFALGDTGVLTAYSANNGQRVWSVQLPEQWSFNDPPTAYDGMVYASGAGEAGTMYGVSEATGQLIWSAYMDDGAANGSPAVNSTGLYVSYSCEQDYRFHLDGLLAWHHSGTCDGGGGSAVVLHGGSVYARGGDGSDPPQDPPVILAQSNGSDTGSFTSGTAPAFDGGTMVTVQQGALVTVSGGRHRWSFGNGSLATPPVVSDGVVFEGSRNGIVYGVSASTGRRVWSARAGSVIIGGDDDEGGSGVLIGLAIGGGLLVVPAGNQVSAFG